MPSPGRPVKRRHHFTPVLYLKNFTDAEGRLHVTLLDNGHRFEQTPENFGFERDFYRPTHLEEGEDPNVFEDAFADLEGDCAPVLRRIIDDRALPSDDESLGLLYNFIALQDARTPQARRMTDGPRAQVAEIILDMLRSDPRLYERSAKQAGIDLNEHPYERFKEFKGKYSIKVPTEAFVKDVMTRMDTVLQFLHRRSWSILYTDRPAEPFVVSDDPVVLSWSTGSYRQPPGHAHRNTDLTIPLSSNVALLGRYDQLATTIEATAASVAAINTRTIASGGRFIASANPEFTAMLDGKVVGSDELVRRIQAGGVWSSRRSSARPPDGQES